MWEQVSKCCRAFRFGYWTGTRCDVRQPSLQRSNEEADTVMILEGQQYPVSQPVVRYDPLTNKVAVDIDVRVLTQDKSFHYVRLRFNDLQTVQLLADLSAALMQVLKDEQNNA